MPAAAHAPGPEARRPTHRHGAARPARRALVMVGALALGLGAVLSACGTGGSPGGAAGSAASGPAPGGSLTLLGERTSTLASFRGSPTLVWFVADGCASCAVSIPAMASRLSTFAGARTRVLVLGLYGTFDPGAQGLRELAGFGRIAAGAAFSNPAWTWGMASAQLTAAFDPQGVPDDYFLLDASGHVVYRNSVPVSTMGLLLSHLQRLTGVALDPAATASTSTTGETIP